MAVTIESAQHIIDDDDNDVALKNYSDESGQRRVHATLIDKDSSQRLPGASSRSLPLTSKQSISNNELVTHADLLSANPSSEGEPNNSDCRLGGILCQNDKSVSLTSIDSGRRKKRRQDGKALPMEDDPAVNNLQPQSGGQVCRISVCVCVYFGRVLSSGWWKKWLATTDD